MRIHDQIAVHGSEAAKFPPALLHSGQATRHRAAAVLADQIPRPGPVILQIQRRVQTAATSS